MLFLVLIMCYCMEGNVNFFDTTGKVFDRCAGGCCCYIKAAVVCAWEYVCVRGGGLMLWSIR